MTNVVAFPTETAPAKAKTPAKPAKKLNKRKADAKLYGYHNLELAIKIASILDQNVEVMDLLYAALRSWTLKKQAWGHLAPEVEEQCGRYLDEKYQHEMMPALIRAEFL